MWNPHLIIQCLTCIHCIVALYAKPTFPHSRIYIAGQLLLLLLLLLKILFDICAYYYAGGLFILWLITAFIVGFGQDGRAHLLESSTWVSCLMLFVGSALFIYVQEQQGNKDLLWNLVFQLQMVSMLHYYFYYDNDDADMSTGRSTLDNTHLG